MLILVAACATPDVTGTYEGAQPAASAGGERQVAVMLDADGSATLTSALSGTASRSPVKGKWRRTRDEVIVTLEQAPRYEDIVFRRDGDKLVATWWERSTWGAEGPGTLTRVR